MSLNKVILIGNVGRDPEVRYFDSGSAIANFPMATSERGYTLANGTVVPERTEWHNIVVRRDQVAFVEKWVRKGSGVYVEGKIRTRTYDDQAGVKHYVTEIHADRVEFYNIGSRPEGSTGQAATGGQPAASPSASAGASSPSATGAPAGATRPPTPPTYLSHPTTSAALPAGPALPTTESNDPDDLPF
jgi:single-strand DNA-binding protein